MRHLFSSRGRTNDDEQIEDTTVPALTAEGIVPNGPEQISTITIECSYAANGQALGNLAIIVRGLRNLEGYRNYYYTGESNESVINVLQMDANTFCVITYDYTCNPTSPLIEELLGCFPDTDKDTFAGNLAKLAAERQEWHNAHMQDAPKDSIIYHPEHRRIFELGSYTPDVEQKIHDLLNRLNGTEIPAVLVTEG